MSDFENDLNPTISWKPFVYISFLVSGKFIPTELFNVLVLFFPSSVEIFISMWK